MDLKNEVTQFLNTYGNWYESDCGYVFKAFLHGWLDETYLISPEEEDEEHPVLDYLNGMNLTYVSSYGGEDMGDELWSVYKFSKDGQEVLVKFDGWYQSYNGGDYNEWFFVKPVTVQVIKYEKE